MSLYEQLPQRKVGSGVVCDLSLKQIADLHSNGLDRGKLYERGFSYEDWSGGTYTQANEILRSGNRPAANRAESIREAIEVNSGVQKQLLPTPVIGGGYLSVPAYLAGSPMAFRRPLPEGQPQGVRIFADIALSAAYSNEQLINRGLAILGFARALSGRVPVELYAIASNDNSHWSHKRHDWVIVKTPLGLSPLDWSAAAGLLCSPTTYRRFYVQVQEWLLTTEGSWGKTGCGRPRQSLTEEQRASIGARPTDLVFTGACLGGDDLSMRDPRAWITREVAAFNKRGK
jgi:hypothetical protein